MTNDPEVPAPAPQSRPARRLLAASRWVFTPLAVVFLAYFGWRARDSLSAVIAQADPAYLLSAVALWTALHLGAPLLSARILRACGTHVDYATAFRIYARRLPGRYVPGGIWHTVGRTVDYFHFGVPPRQLGALVFLESALPAAVAFVMGGAGLAAFRGLDAWGTAGAVGAAAGAGCLALLPAVVRGRVLKAGAALAWRPYLTLCLLYAAYWWVATAAFLCYVAAFPAVAPGSWLEMGAAYLFAWAIGFIAVFAPQGIGVFEVVAGRLLGGAMPLGGAAALMAGFRLVIVAADVLVWVLSYRGGAAPRARSLDR